MSRPLETDDLEKQTAMLSMDRLHFPWMECTSDVVQQWQLTFYLLYTFSAVL
jgi:hypothetical protein